MSAAALSQPVPGARLGTLLRGEVTALADWTGRWEQARVARCLFGICLGSGLYGAAMGWWRSPLQGLFVCIKFPLIILLTTLGNALLNAMIAPLLGMNITFRQSVLAVLMSFTIASAILGSLAPVAAFLVWNAPSMELAATGRSGAYGVVQLFHVAVIAIAGLAANLRLASLLNHLGGGKKIGRRVLVAWLAGNLFLGSQLCWIMRPFIGSPGLAVQFFRPDAFKGNFYESVFYSFSHLWTFNP